jgi:hypothetical protein
MSKRGKDILSRLDDAVRWTGIPGRVAPHLSGAGPDDVKQPPLRWSPIGLIVLACALFVLSLKWPSALLTSLGAAIAAIAPGIHQRGPLGRSSLEDDEREAALRKDAFLFCLGVLAFLNCAGQLLLLGVYVLRRWDTADAVFAGASVLMLNLTLFWCLPTLHASWKLRQLPDE